ncbi:hypothetical protein M8J77_004425 [Diaphorina citri]|nr:hypothetical protein M8J77_004425 [Diaphorina citri]
MKLRTFTKDNNITKLGLPKLCSGPNTLDWKVVKRLINNIFIDSNMEIIVYSLQHNDMCGAVEDVIAEDNSSDSPHVNVPPDNRRTRMVFANDDYLLLPRSNSIIQTTSKFGGLGYFKPNLNFLETNQLFIEEQVVRSTLSEIVVINPTSYHKYIRKGHLIGIIQSKDSPLEIINTIETGSDVSHSTVQRLKDRNLDLRNPFKDLGGNVIDICSKLSTNEKLELRKLLNRYIHVFAKNEYDFLTPKIDPYNIELEQEDPVYCAPYKLGPKEREILDSIIDEWVEAGILEPCNEGSEYCSPMFLVPKKDGGKRLVCDFRKINEKIKRDVTPIGNFQTIFDCLEGSKLFSSMDINSAFLNMPLSEKCRKYTTVTSHRGLYRFLRLPQGLKTSPSAWTRAIVKVLNPVLYRGVVVYVDDILAYSGTFEAHLKTLEAAFQRLSDNNLKIKASKCAFGYDSVDVLGHNISSVGVFPAQNNVQSIKNIDIKSLGTQKGVRAFLGAVGFFRKFIKSFSQIAFPLTQLTKKEYEKKKIVLNEEQKKAFYSLKEAITKCPVLEYFNPQRETVLYSDASAYGLGGCLLQIDEEGREHPIAFVSRKLKDVENRYSSSELELTSLVYLVNHWREYLLFQHFTVYTDNRSLIQITKNVKDRSSRLQRLVTKLIDFNFRVKHVSGRANKVADFLSRFPEEKFAEDDKIDACLNVIVKNLNKMQMEDDYLFKIYSALINPDNADKRHYRLSRNYVLQDDILYYKHFNKDKKQLLIAVPQSLVSDILKFYHDNCLNGAHLGAEKTYWKIKLKYYWPTMLNDITNYIKSCESCQKRKVSRTGKQGLLQPINVPITGKPMESVFIDFMGPINPKSKGCQYIIVLTDSSTKYVIAKAVREATAKVTADFLLNVITTFGCFKELHSDRGSHFINETVRLLCKSLQIDHKISSPYRPQSQAYVERMNGVICDMISHYVNDQGSNWANVLNAVVFSYNNTPHQVTKYSPSYLMFGFEPTQPADLEILTPLESDHDVVKAIDNINKIRRDIPSLIRRSQDKQKANYDKSHRDVRFTPGQMVLVSFPNINDRNNSKFNNRYKGPWQVLRQISDVNYVIRLERNGRMVDDVVHVARMKPFYTR